MTRFGAVTLALALPLALTASASVSEAKDNRKTKSKSHQEYMTIKMNDALITSYGRTQPDKNKSQTKPGSTLSR